MNVVREYEDTLGHTVYCARRLLTDDISYEKRVNVVYPALEVVGHSALTWGLTRFVLNTGYSRISLKTWERNIAMGWEWDKDPIQPNFVGHPYSGALSFASARASGYNFYQAFPFAVGGSLLWEYFGENERPSYNDIISTPVAGVYWGEVMHHISSNVLDDRSVGAERVFREIFAGLIDPVRGFDRLVSGKTARRSQCEVYQKEPVDVGIASGVHIVNDGTQFGTGHANALVSIQVDYGDPFEIRRRKPFDFFSFRGDLSYGPSRKPLDNINGKGLLAGVNLGNRDDNRIFVGAFEHFDYWNNEFFVMSALGLGGDLITRARLGTNAWFYNSFSAAAVPLSGIGSRLGGDTASSRDYSYAAGMELKLESRLEFGDKFSLGVNAYYCLVHAFYGREANNVLAAIRPGLTVKLSPGFWLGIEEQLFYNDNFPDEENHVHFSTEQKCFLRYFWDGVHRNRHSPHEEN